LIMRILFTVELYEPHKGGAEEVIKQLAERLVDFGHEVFVATSFLPERESRVLNGVDIEDFKISGNLALGIVGDKDEVLRYQNFLKGDWDILVNYAAQSWTTDLAFEVLPEIKAKKVLIPCGYSGLLKTNVCGKIKDFGKWIFSGFRSDSLGYSGYFEEMPKYLVLYDKIVYMSGKYQDKKFGDDNGVSDRAVIIPNGASKEEFLGKQAKDLKESLDIKTSHLALTVANHYSAKGHGFVIKAFKKMSRKDTTLLIIGKLPSFGLKKMGHLFFGCYPFCWLADKLNENIVLLDGTDRGLVLAAYKNSDLFLFGSEIEYAPLVMYEAFAAKTLFITRDVGNVKDHRKLLKIVETPEEMAKTANFYLDHLNERAKITDQAFSEWQEKYSWERIAQEYLNLFESLCQK